MNDRRRILGQLVEGSLSVFALARRMNSTVGRDFDWRQRIGWACGWLRRRGLLERIRPADGAGPASHGRHGTWQITNLGRAVLDGRCSATVFRSNQEGRCLRRAVQDLRCRQHADHTHTGTSPSIIVNAIPPAFASLTRSHTARNAAAATAG
jgi:hypothetical protein